MNGSIKIKGCTFFLHPNVYVPSEDSFLLAEYVVKAEGKNMLDIGTGVGLLAILAAKRGFEAVATDINSFAVKCGRYNAKINGVENKIDFRLGSMFEPVGSNELFDLIVFNPPYIPERRENSDFLETAWRGGDRGRELIDEFIRNVKRFLSGKGRAAFVQTDINGLKETLELGKKYELRCNVLKSKKLFFEKLYLMECV